MNLLQALLFFTTIAVFQLAASQDVDTAQGFIERELSKSSKTDYPTMNPTCGGKSCKSSSSSRRLYASQDQDVRELSKSSKTDYPTMNPTCGGKSCKSSSSSRRSVSKSKSASSSDSSASKASKSED